MERSETALAHLRVVEIVEDNYGAILCGRMLAELGADVMMIEPRSGHVYRKRGAPVFDDVTLAFETAARGKRSVALDVGASEDRNRIIHALAAADVLVTDREAYRALTSAGVMASIENASLVTCCVSPYGLTGPHADARGSELTVQALAGVLSTNGEPADPPIQAGVPVAALSGAFYALIGVLAALHERRRSGAGQLIDQSLFDALIACQGTLVPGYLRSGEEFRRVGNRHTLTAPWNHFRTADGWIVIATVGNEQWHRLAGLIGRVDLIDDDRYRNPVDRIRNVESLDAVIEHWSAARTSEVALHELATSEVPASAILTLAQAVADSHAVERMVVKHDGTAAARLPFRLSASGMLAWGEVPKLGSSRPEWTSPPFASHARTMVTEREGPLADVKVIEAGILTAGPLVGRILGMLGADVIKIEPPGGERTRKMGEPVAGTSYLYFLNNTDKSGCTLDLDTPNGRSALHALCSSADIFITNLGEETLDQMGASFDQLSAHNDRLIYGMTSGYGLSGPYRGRKTFDTTIQASSGIMSLTGLQQGHPLKVGLSIVDLLAALSTTAGILAALVARPRAGRGQIVDAALLDAGLWATQDHWPALFRSSTQPQRLGNRHRHHAPHNCFEAVDGWIALAVESDAQWEAWCRIAGRPDLVADARFQHAVERLSHVEEVEAIVRPWIAHKSTSEAVELCIAAGVPAAPVLTLSQAVEQPLSREREMLVSQSRPSVGTIRVIGAAIKMSRSKVAVQRMAPDLGEHNNRLPSNQTR